MLRKLQITKRNLLFLLFATLLAQGTSASDFPPADETYFQDRLGKKLEIIYGKSFSQKSRLLSSSSLDIYKEYQNVFGATPRNKNFMVFISPQKQIANAFVQVYPLPVSGFYSSPAYLIDKLPVNQWLEDALAHEMAHVFQLNAQTRFSNFLSYFLPSQLWFIHPNIYITNFILEGHAVLHESIYGSSGRLFSGFSRAFVFAQLKEGLTLKRVLNIYNDAFSSDEKYLHGGYFFSYLHRNYSLKQIGKIFNVHSKKFILPIGLYPLNKTFKKTFGKSFDELFKEYKNFYLSKAIHQKKSPEPVLLKSYVDLKMNSDKDSVFFLTSDKRSPPQLIVIDKKTQKFTSKSVDMPLGKLFKIDNEYYSVATAQVSTTREEFALFKDGNAHLPWSRSLYVTDMNKDKIAYLDSKQMLDEFRLYIDRQFYDSVNSTAVLDSANSVYYFKQNKEVRTLYKDKTALTSFKGYYGFPVESDEDGVFFIASTAYGSSLFSYKNGQIFRLSSSDRIVNARKINSNQFLVSEVSASDYQYKIISTQEIEEEPFFYQYSFEKKDIFKEVNHKKKISLKSLDTYFPIENLKFQNLDLELNTYNFNPETYEGLELKSDLTYMDPMQKNSLSFSGLWSPETSRGSVKYQNTSNRLNWMFSYEHEKGLFSLKNSKNLVINIDELGVEAIEKVINDILNLNNNFKYTHNEFKGNLIYPIVKTQNSKINFFSEKSVGFQTIESEKKKQKNYFRSKNTLSFLHKRKYSKAIGYYTKIKLDFFYDFLHILDNNSYYGAGSQFEIQKEIAKGFYITSQGEWSHNLKYNPTNQLFQKEKTNDSLSFDDFTLKENIRDIKRIHLSIKKELDHSLYSAILPLSLRRWAPTAGVSFVDLKKDASLTAPHYILYTFLGGEFDVALNYAAPTLIGISVGFIWKWNEHFDKVKPRIYNSMYLKTKF